MYRALAPIVAMLTLPALACGGSGKDANEDILGTLPVPPGAQLQTVETYPIRDCGLIFRRTVGYVTNAVYRVPQGVSGEGIIDFYTEQLRDQWDFRQEHIDAIRVGGPEPDPVPTPPPTVTLPPGPEPAMPQPVQAIRIPSVNFERGNATLSITVFPASPGSPADASHDFTVSIDAEGKEERPYCD